MLMEVCDARPSPSLLGWKRSFRPRPFRFERSTPPLLFHWMPLRNPLTLHLRIHSYLLNSPVMSSGKDNSTTGWELCRVLWSIEADIEDGRLLYITGDLPALGCWEPELAILMSPCREHASLWKTEIKVPCGLNFRYNYFVKEDTWPSCDLVWRPGPDFSLSVPLCFRENEKIVVRDSWIKDRTVRLPVPSWGSWLEDMCNQPLIEFSGHQSQSAGENEIVENPENISSGQKQIPVNLMLRSESHSVDEETVKHTISNPGSNSERDQPVEEPWLLQSSILPSEFWGMLDSDVSSHRSVKNEDTCMDFHGKEYQGLEGFVPDEENKVGCIEEPVCTDILINSSVCAVQRIAVLEDGKLVELLLEPVKNNVHCDSVYLGVITKLVPHMGGAFVDIGISRPSFMEIKQNREPFVYPPFLPSVNEWEVDDTGISKHKEHLDAHERDPAGEDGIIEEFLEAAFLDDSVESALFMPDDFEELEVEEETDDSDALKGSVNGALVDYGGSEVDFEDYFEENGHRMEGKAANEFLPLEMESSNNSELSHHMLLDVNVSDNAQGDVNKWDHVRKGTKIIVQVVKEGLGSKGPTLTAYPCLRSRFWILSTRDDRAGVSKKITGVERTRLRVIAKTLQPPGFGVTIRTVASGHSLEELQKDLDGLLSTWKDIVEHAKSAALAADEGVEGAIPVILHRAMGQTLSVVQDYFNDKVKSMVVDSPRTFHEVTNYLQEIAPDLCDRVELYNRRIPIFDEYGIEEEINNILSKRVPLSNGGSLVIEQTEALVSIDVNGGHGILGQGTSQEKAILDVNLAAAKQIARELRLRDIGGIIVVDFIDMVDESNKRLVYEEVKKAVERDRSIVKVSELSKHGLMEITRKRVRPSVTFMISERCTCCHGTGRVEALETSFSKIEHEICRHLAMLDQKADPENAKSWPKFVLRVDNSMCNYLTSGKRTRLAVLSSSLKVWILLKVARGFARGAFELKPFIDDKANGDHQRVAITRLRSMDAGSHIPTSKLTLFPVKKWKAPGCNKQSTHQSSQTTRLFSPEIQIHSSVSLTRV